MKILGIPAIDLIKSGLFPIISTLLYRSESVPLGKPVYKFLEERRIDLMCTIICLTTAVLTIVVAGFQSHQMWKWELLASTGFIIQCFVMRKYNNVERILKNLDTVLRTLDTAMHLGITRKLLLAPDVPQVKTVVVEVLDELAYRSVRASFIDPQGESQRRADSLFKTLHKAFEGLNETLGPYSLNYDPARIRVGKERAKKGSRTLI